MAKISEVTGIDALAAGDKFPVADASAAGTDKSATAAQVQTFVLTDPVGATPGGNAGYVPVRHFIRCDAARTLPNDTATNAIFNSPANGRVTLETGTYLFEGMILVASMSGTSGNAQIDLLGAGTATIGAWLWMLQGIDAATAGTLVDLDSPFFQTNITAASAVTAGTGATLRLFVKGTFEVTVAGTFIPSIDLVTAAAAVVQIGSYIMLERIGSTSVVSVGAWD